jgi:YggT family protein
MDAILNFTEFVIQALLSLVVWIVVVYVIVSWLISFDIVNLRNRLVYRLSHLLEAMALPLLRPFRRFLPSFGGLDFSPIILIILIEGLKMYIIPPLFAWLHGLVGGGAGV